MKKILVLSISLLILLNSISCIDVFATEKFSDVPKTHWAYESIIKLSDKGIVNGYPDGTFLPDAPVSRGEFCKMLSISGGLISNINKTLSYKNWAYPYFVAMKENTWDYSDWYLKEFDADITINRGEVAIGICDVYKGYPISLVGSMAEVKATLEITYKDYIEIGSFSEVVYIMTINNLMNGYEDRCFHTERQERALNCVQYWTERFLKINIII